MGKRRIFVKAFFIGESLSMTSFRACDNVRARVLFVGLIGLLAPCAMALATPVIVDLYGKGDPAALAAKYGIVPSQVFTEVGRGFIADVTSRQIQQLEADPAVQEVAPDGIAGRIEPGKIRPLNRGDAARFSASDVSKQPPQLITPEILRVKADLSRIADIDFRNDKRIDVDIAIVDGGIDPTHPELNVVGGFNCVRGEGRNAWHDHGDGHGTFVAGLAAAYDNKIGVVGVAPGARLWSVRVGDLDGYITDSALLCGLDYVARKKQIHVVNMSFGGFDNPRGPCLDPQKWPRHKWGKNTPRVDKVHQRLCLLNRKGITLVAGAGNDFLDAAGFTPAAYPEVIAVSAITDFDGLPGALSPVPPYCYPTDVDDTFAVFSNYGKVIDISAPGTCMTSTFPGGDYAVGDGTSFATPMVTGAAALLYARKGEVTPEQVRAKIRQRAQKGTITGDPDGIDEGVLDVSTF